MKCKKLGVLLAMVLVGVSASPTWTVSAAESQDLPQQVLDISNGSDEIYGPGAPIEHVENPDKRFSSGGVDHTHQYIVSNALKILNNDKGASILNTKAAMICEYTDKAMEYIGKGTHYVSDLNEPHHASNLTAVNSNHSDFEKYVDKHRTEYTIAGNSFGADIYSSAENTAVGDMLYSAAKDAKALVGMAQNKDTYDSAGNQSVQNAIKTVSKYIYKFGKEVGIY